MWISPRSQKATHPPSLMHIRNASRGGRRGAFGMLVPTVRPGLRAEISAFVGLLVCAEVESGLRPVSELSGDQTDNPVKVRALKAQR